VYNLGEGKKNPDKVRQKYLASFFGPTAVGTSAFRAIRNTMMPLFWHSWMNMIFATPEFAELMRTLTVKKFADVILSMPFIQIRTFRSINTLYFTMIGWAVFYVVWKWTNNAPIIAGKRRKRSENELSNEKVKELMHLAYLKTIEKLDADFKKIKFEDDQSFNSEK
jgi:hypothetical protein